MSQVKLLKDALENAYTIYKRHLSALSRATATATATPPTSSTRNLQSKLNSLMEALDNLNAAHTAWKLKADLTPEDLTADTHSDKWLEGRWEEADTQIDSANDALHLE